MLLLVLLVLLHLAFVEHRSRSHGTPDRSGDQLERFVVGYRHQTRIGGHLHGRRSTARHSPRRRRTVHWHIVPIHQRNIRGFKFE